MATLLSCGVALGCGARRAPPEAAWQSAPSVALSAPIHWVEAGTELVLALEIINRTAGPIQLQRLELSARVGSGAWQIWTLEPQDPGSESPTGPLRLPAGAVWSFELRPSWSPAHLDQAGEIPGEIVVQGTLVWSHWLGEGQATTFRLDRTIGRLPQEDP